METMHVTDENISFDRQIIVVVKDADNNLLENAQIEWSMNGRPRGKVSNSYGRAAIFPNDNNGVVEVSVMYEGHTETRKIAIGQDECKIIFPDVHIKPPWRVLVEKHFPALIGIAFLLIAVILTFSFQNTNVLQTRIILALFALGGGAFGTEISGIIKADIKLGTQVVIGATGAAAIFVILYLVVPAS